MKESLQARLAVWLGAAILGVAIVSGAFSFRQAYVEAHDLQDSLLRQMAWLVRPDGGGHPAGWGDVAPDERDPESRIWVQVLSPTPTHHEPDDLPLPPSMSEGLQTVQVAGVGYRVMVHVWPGGERVAVAQATEVRDEIARSSALHTLLPLALLTPILALVSMVLIRRELRPVRALAREVAQRHEQDLQPLSLSGLPVEIAPFVRAINDLMTRIDQSMSAQRRFVADAAHELRSPLAALALQSERLAQASLPAEAAGRLAVLRAGLDRARHLLDQMLSLARAQSSASVGLPARWTAVGPVCTRVLEDLFPLAEARGVDLGLGAMADAQVAIGEVELQTLLRNIVDNAIRYAPAGGHVDLMAQVEGDRVHLTVDDDGPGIAENERERVLEPFYRVLGSQVSGSGLGLAIVDALVRRAGGSLSLSVPVAQQHGLSVRVTLPARGGIRTAGSL